MECSICYEDVSYNDYVNLDCCNKLTHILCINRWIRYNININTDIHLCIYCKKGNDYISSIIYYINQENNNNLLDSVNYSINESNNNMVDHSINESNNNMVGHSNRRLYNNLENITETYDNDINHSHVITIVNEENNMIRRESGSENICFIIIVFSIFIILAMLININNNSNNN
jgi:hypothetical protein